jgi:diacylglycerol kinase (ATP)
MRSAELIYNPRSGRQLATGELPRVLETLEAGGFHVEPRPTTGPGAATELARGAVARGVEVAFAMGGDGTLREVAAGLLGSPVALGLLPAGTTNVLALALGLPRRALKAAQAAAGLEVREIDAGMVGDEPFLMLASCGVDAAVMAGQDGDLKRRFGKAAIAWLALEQLRSYTFPPFELRFEGRREEVEYFAACNIPFYAGSFRMAPEAVWHDGLLDLLLFRGRGRLASLGFFRDLGLGRHHKRRDVEIRQVAELELLGEEGLPVQIDGDVIWVEPPVRIALAAERLRVLA